MKAGLRTEVVVSIALLLGAALLFSGFLQVKLTEMGLLVQQRTDLRRTMSLLGSAVGELSFTAAPDPAEASGLRPLLNSLSLQEDVLAWRVLDREARVIAEMSTGSLADFFTVYPALIELQEISERLHYSSVWNPFDTRTLSYLDIAVPFGPASKAAGMLQVRFSLAPLEQQVHKAQKLVLVYVLLYGSVLSVFGVYTLNRKVVRPVRHLQQATANVAAGELQAIKVPHGPGEIHDLAESFNQMVRALIESRNETEAHIASLEKANQEVLQARDDLLRSEKMASVGHLSAGMAHEIGNPLSAIVGYLNLLNQDLADPAGRDLVERSLAAANRIDLLIRELLDYAAPGSVAMEDFEPVAVLREAVEMVRHQGLLGDIRIKDLCQPLLGAVHMNRGQFTQVCINLILNARDAMPDGGTLTLSSQQDERTIGLAIVDEGIGMDGETLRKIFEPFFTTKDPGKGTGLGLSVCQRIIDQAGGRIEVRSEAGCGSSFSIYLPQFKETNE
jgi:signal transduction histidine kinase